MSLFLPLLKNIPFIIMGVFGIGLLIGFHELGHFIFARLFGVRVPSFSIGMGPTLWTKRVGETEFKLSAIPLGGYVEIAGLAEIGQGEQEHSHATGAGSFQQISLWRKWCILGGGIFFNGLFTYLILVLLFLIGMPQSIFYKPANVRPVIASIQPDSCAQRIQLAINDEIIGIDNRATPSVTELITQLRQHKEQDITLTVKRGEQILTITAHPDQRGALGITAFQPTYLPSCSIGTSLVNAWQALAELTGTIISSFASLFHKRSLDGVGGPMMIISWLINSAQQHFLIFLFFLAFISVNLAVINLIPLPITDGGQLVLETIQSAIGRRLPEKALLTIAYASWALIIALTTYLTIKDSIALFWPKIKLWLGW